MTTLLLGYCIIHDFLITQAILNSEDHISVSMCLIRRVLTVRKNRRQLVEQLFTLNCIFLMCDNYSPWEYEMWDVRQEFSESSAVRKKKKKETTLADKPPKLLPAYFKGNSIHNHHFMYHIILIRSTQHCGDLTNVKKKCLSLFCVWTRTLYVLTISLPSLIVY